MLSVTPAPLRDIDSNTPTSESKDSEGGTFSLGNNSNNNNNPRSLLDSKDSNQESNVLNKAPLSIAVARPHHLPKLDSLANKMEEIRRNMSLQQNDEEAPWDTNGRPVKKKKQKKEKKLSQGDEEFDVSTRENYDLGNSLGADSKY